jgi:hypothetical protein
MFSILSDLAHRPPPLVYHASPSMGEVGKNRIERRRGGLADAYGN